jgi:hypothetical protein
MAIIISNIGLKDGLPAFGIAVIGLLFWIVMVVVMIIQLFVKYSK